MRNAEAINLQLVIHNDDQTPWEFVVDLVSSVFDPSVAEAETLAATVSRVGKAACGSYPSAVATAMLDTAQQRIKAAGYPLRITADPGETESSAAVGHPAQAPRDKKFKYAHEAIAWHFAGVPQDDLVARSRQFPGHMRADVQVAIDKLFSAAPPASSSAFTSSLATRR